MADILPFVADGNGELSDELKRFVHALARIDDAEMRRTLLDLVESIAAEAE